MKMTFEAKQKGVNSANHLNVLQFINTCISAIQSIQIIVTNLNNSTFIREALKYCLQYFSFYLIVSLFNTCQGLLYTINVLVIKVVAYLLISPSLIIYFPSLILYLSLAQSSNDFSKLYIGQLPLSITEPFVRDALSKFTEVRDVRIIKGDARGTFDRFCFAFVMIRGNQDLCNKVIKKVNQQMPEWKMNVKPDNDRFKNMQQQNQPERNQIDQYNQGQMNQPPQRMNYDQKEPQQNSYGQFQQNPQMNRQFQPQNQSFVANRQPFFNGSQFQNTSANEPQKIVGDKPQRILVRQIWLGGIPELCDRQYMTQLMSEFGIIQNLQIFPKFAFIKFKMVQYAALAFQRAQRIFVMFGNPPGFRIFFSDPSRRANIVGNHYQFDRQSPFLPILFLGFPPVTSATIDLDLMRSICEKFGTITNSYMRKNSNNQTRSYFLFTFDNLKSALRAKIELNKRRDLLGDKRVEVTLLLDEQIVLRGRDFSHTERMFQGDGNQNQKKRHISQKPNTFFKEPSQQFVQKPTYGQGTYSNYSNKDIPPPIVNLPNPSYGGNYHQAPSNIQYPGYMMPQGGQVGQNYLPPDIYYMPPPYFEQNKAKQPQNGRSTDVHEFLQSVFDKSSTERQTQNQNIEKKPVKNFGNNDQNVSDIVSKMLGQQKEAEYFQKDKEREINWSGFLTWKGVKRVAVDGHTQEKQPEDYVISITNLIEPKDVIRKQSSTMVLVPERSLHEPLFKQYLRALKGKVGVSITSHFLMYVMGKSKETDEIRQIKENQLLVVMEKPSLISLIRDKLQKIEELK